MIILYLLKILLNKLKNNIKYIFIINFSYYNNIFNYKIINYYKQIIFIKIITNLKPNLSIKYFPKCLEQSQLLVKFVLKEFKTAKE